MSDLNPIQQAVLSACASNGIDPRHCVISPQILIDGDVKARDGADILVLGEVNGSVTGEGRVVVGAGARVHGRVKAGSLCIEGDVTNLGDGQDIVVAHQLHVRSSGSLKANVIQYGSLVTDAGGRLEGMLKHVPPPAPPKPAPRVNAPLASSAHTPASHGPAALAAVPMGSASTAQVGNDTLAFGASQAHPTPTPAVAPAGLSDDPEPEPDRAPMPMPSAASGAAPVKEAEPVRAPALAAPAAAEPVVTPGEQAVAPDAPSFESPLAFITRPAAVVHELGPVATPSGDARTAKRAEDTAAADIGSDTRFDAFTAQRTPQPAATTTHAAPGSPAMAAAVDSAHARAVEPAVSAPTRSSARPLLAGLPSLDGEFAPVELVQEERPVPTWLMRQATH